MGKSFFYFSLKILIFSLVFLLIICLCRATTQETTNKHPGLIKGIQYYGNSQFEKALQSFRNVTIDSSAEASHGTAYLWLTKTYLALNRIEEAANFIEFYLENFPQHPDYAEGLYYKGRILFLENEYENCIKVFSSFIESYPENEYIPNAYFWVAESLYLTGQLEQAQKIYLYIIETYPRSHKVDASHYRISLIELKYREIELLKLLKLSHEEHLKSIEEYQKRELSYEKALYEYQKRIEELTQDDLKSRLEDYRSALQEEENKNETLSAQISQLRSQLTNKEEQIKKLQAQIIEIASSRISDLEILAEAQSKSQTSEGVPRSDLLKLLQLKADALALKEYYLNILNRIDN